MFTPRTRASINLIIFADLLCKPRNKYQREQRTEHGSSSEREQLFFSVPSREIYQRFESQQRFAASHSNVKCDYVRGK